jgi:YegS/Rv2252/BmrU family lipid kinase
MNTFDRRLYAVVNPKAALGRASRFWPQLQKQLRDRMGPFPWNWTEAPMHATSLVRSALQQGYDLIVSVGGDGTHNEVINGFFTDGAILNPRATLSVVSCGSGSDLCRSLGISSGIASTLATVLSGREREVDVGHLQFSGPSSSACERLFLNIASLGLSARVNNNLANQPHFLGAPGRFLLATVRTLIENRNDRVTLEIDGKIFSDQLISTVVAGNGQFFGGGMRIAPHARLDDRLLDVLMIGRVSLLDFVLWGPRFYRGRYLNHPRVKYLRASTICAKSVDPVPVEVDGETVGTLPASFTVLPGSVRILVPG